MSHLHFRPNRPVRNGVTWKRVGQTGRLSFTLHVSGRPVRVRPGNKARWAHVTIIPRPGAYVFRSSFGVFGFGNAECGEGIKEFWITFRNFSIRLFFHIFQNIYPKRKVREVVDSNSRSSIISRYVSNLDTQVIWHVKVWCSPIQFDVTHIVRPSLQVFLKNFHFSWILIYLTKLDRNPRKVKNLIKGIGY